MKRKPNWKERWEQIEAGWWVKRPYCAVSTERSGWFSYYKHDSKGPFKTATQAVRAAERMERKGKE